MESVIYVLNVLTFESLIPNSFLPLLSSANLKDIGDAQITEKGLASFSTKTLAQIISDLVLTRRLPEKTSLVKPTLYKIEKATFCFFKAKNKNTFFKLFVYETEDSRKIFHLTLTRLSGDLPVLKLTEEEFEKISCSEVLDEQIRKSIVGLKIIEQKEFFDLGIIGKVDVLEFHRSPQGFTEAEIRKIFDSGGLPISGLSSLYYCRGGISKEIPFISCNLVTKQDLEWVNEEYRKVLVSLFLQG